MFKARVSYFTHLVNGLSVGNMMSPPTEEPSKDDVNHVIAPLDACCVVLIDWRMIMLQVSHI